MSQHMRTLFADGTPRVLAAGEPLFHLGDAVGFMYLVTEGEVRLTRQSTAGLAMTLQRAGPGEVPAEASAYSDAYHCDGRTSARTRLVSVSVGAFRAKLAQDPAAAEAWAAHLARSVQAARMRAEIRTLRTVAERLDAWLGERADLPEKGTWTGLAADLGVTREALYRELARRRAPR